MRILTCSKLITALIAILSLASLGATLLHSRLAAEREHSLRVLIDSHDAIGLLGEGSDRLTDAVRAYAITGEEQYRQAFHRELDAIRSRELATERLRALGASPEELALIAQAKQHSDALLDTERAAFAAMARGARQSALELLYSPAYARAKADVDAPLLQAHRLVDARLQGHIQQLSRQAQATDTLALGLLVGNALLMLGVLQVFYRRRLINPIVSMTAKTRYMLTADAGSIRFDEGAPGSEIADLAHALEDSRQAGLAVQAQAAQMAQQAHELAASKQRLHQTEAWYRGLIESAPDAVLVVDEQGVIRLTNLKLESLFGYGSGELLGKPLTSLAPPRAQGVYAELLQQLLQDGSPQPSMLLPGARRDGTEFPLEATLALLPPCDGHALNMCAVLRDISARMEEEEEMRRARALAEKAAQAKSDFLANMSHEVRTPLNTIVGMAHLLGKTSLESLQSDYLRQIQQASEHLRAVIDDILDFSHIEDGELELEPAAFRLQDVIDTLTQRFADQARRKGLHFSCTAAADLPANLIGDSQRITQVLAQFVDNAIKFTATGEIEISLGGHRLPREQFELNVFVRDTGIGLTPEQQESLFDDFYQADTSSTRRYDGTGLGLALSNRLAVLMGGSVGVQSDYGLGSTFWLSVPLDIAARNLPPALPRLDLQGRRVLLAEDHDANRRLVCKLLEHVGVQVEVAENGREAVDRVRAHDYDLVLMDMQMPVLDGAAATLEIRRLGPRGQLPIIAISASAMPEDRRRCFEAGMNDFIAKPIRIEELYASLRQWCQPKPSAALPATAGTPAVPQVPGLDTDEGLQRVQGDLPLYLRLLSALAEKERDSPRKIREALARGDLHSARRMAHTLKGMAATVGAREVMSRAAELEQCLTEQTPNDLRAEALERLDRPLTALLDALAEALVAPSSPAANSANPKQLARICAKLATLLREDDAEALTWFNEQSGPLRAALADGYPGLEHAIHNFEFTKALTVLQPLMSRLEAAPHRSDNA
jgi:PAS domain S-box-containing protein